MLDIQATWSRSLCSGPSGSGRNPSPTKLVGASKSSGTNGSVIRALPDQRTEREWAGKLVRDAIAPARCGDSGLRDTLDLGWQPFQGGRHPFATCLQLSCNG